METYKKILRGATSQTIYVHLKDNDQSDTDLAYGAPKTGLIHSDMTASYVRNLGARVAITPVTLAAATTAWTSGGFKEVDATNCPGLYRFDVPNAAFAVAAGVDEVVISLIATDTVSHHVLIPLTDDSRDYNSGISDTVRTNS